MRPRSPNRSANTSPAKASSRGSAASIAQATEAFEQFDPDFVLLDVMLPDGDGRDLCRDIRKHSDVPIIMLTARGEEIDRIVGLELGADDYVVKPFSAGELVARMRAITRRGRPNERKTPLTVGAITLDPAVSHRDQGR